MPSAACRIRSKQRPWWVEIDIGVGVAVLTYRMDFLCV